MMACLRICYCKNEEPIVIDDKNVSWFRNDVPGTTVDTCVVAPKS